MGCLYQRRICRTCNKHGSKLKACVEAGHDVTTLPNWYIAYYSNGRQHIESTETDKKTEALKILKSKEGKIADGVPVSPKMNRLTFDDAIEDVVNDYMINKRRSLKTINERIKHLKPFFTGRRMMSITMTDQRRYIKHRQEEKAANGTINRELGTLKRAFSLAVDAEKLHHKPKILKLKENNVRTGFFEAAQFDNVRKHLPPHMRGIASFANITGWRTPSEILPLEWRHVDMKAEEVRLDPGTTKNDEGRVFPFTAELRKVLDEQQKVAERLKKAGVITPYVFCYPEPGKFGGRELKAGRRITESGYYHAWVAARTQAAKKDARCLGRIAHDFRRTAIRNLERKGVSRSVAMKLTGHKTEAVYRRYAIVSSEDLRDAVRRLESEDNYNSNYNKPSSRPARKQTAQNS